MPTIAPTSWSAISVRELPTLLVVDKNRVLARLVQPRGRAEVQTALAPWLR